MKVVSILFVHLLLALNSAFADVESLGLRFLEAKCDFGELGPVQTVEKVLTVSNASPVKVNIVRVRACCGVKADMLKKSLLPDEVAQLRVSMTTGASPGEFRKSVTVISDDPVRPILSLPVEGYVRESQLRIVGDAVALEDGESGLPGKTSAAANGAIVSLSVPSVMIAGIVDGFNPCSFAIMISLAGILAIGGRKRRMRILGGIAFCIGSFIAYMLIGLGLMQALKALQSLRMAHDIVMVVLSLALFVLAGLSVRDAIRFYRVPVFSVVTLKLPEGIKNLIRRIAMSSWSGPAVVLTGFGCAFLVTVLDSLCTGQVYFPVLTLLAKEGDFSRAFALLVLYNASFILPLVAVFVLASKTTDAFQMAKWSSKNVIPAKMALALVFAFLGWMLWPKTYNDIAQTAPEKTVFRSFAKPQSKKADNVGSSKTTEVEKMTDAELASGNERLNELLRASAPDSALPSFLAAVVSDRMRDEQWRNHCLQFVPECMMRLDVNSPERAMLHSVLANALSERSTVLAGTALLGFCRLSEALSSPTKQEVCSMALSIASDASSAKENIITAMRVGAERKFAAMLEPAYYWARNSDSQFVRCVAISAIRDLGDASSLSFLRSLLPAHTKAEEYAIKDAVNKIEAGK